MHSWLLNNGLINLLYSCLCSFDSRADLYSEIWLQGSNASDYNGRNSMQIPKSINLIMLWDEKHESSAILCNAEAETVPT